MIPTDAESREQLRVVWQASRDRQRASCADDDALQHQLRVIDQRILAASASAHTSNRARGAVRQWTHKRAQLIASHLQAAHPGHGDDLAAEQAERLLIAGAPQHLRVDESQARHAVALATKRLEALHPESLPSDVRRAQGVLAQAHATHAAALAAACNWNTGECAAAG